MDCSGVVWTIVILSVLYVGYFGIVYLNNRKRLKRERVAFIEGD